MKPSVSPFGGSSWLSESATMLPRPLLLAVPSPLCSASASVASRLMQGLGFRHHAGFRVYGTEMHKPPAFTALLVVVPLSIGIIATGLLASVPHHASLVCSRQNHVPDLLHSGIPHLPTGLVLMPEYCERRPFACKADVSKRGLVWF